MLILPWGWIQLTQNRCIAECSSAFCWVEITFKKDDPGKSFTGFRIKKGGGDDFLILPSSKQLWMKSCPKHWKITGVHEFFEALPYHCLETNSSFTPENRLKLAPKKETRKYSFAIQVLGAF